MKQRCFNCGCQFEYGPHVYDGNYIRRYKITVCMDCYDSNRDGWSNNAEEKILEHLEEENIAIPNRNENGRLPRD